MRSLSGRRMPEIDADRSPPPVVTHRMRRVVVTGLGLVTPLGVGVGEVWRRLINGESGIRGLQSCGVSDLPCKIAGEVPRGDRSSRKRNSDDYALPENQPKMGTVIPFARGAAE